MTSALHWLMFISVIQNKMAMEFHLIKYGEIGFKPVAPARGAKGAVVPNVEKDDPRNSSKFDEKIGMWGGYPS